MDILRKHFETVAANTPTTESQGSQASQDQSDTSRERDYHDAHNDSIVHYDLLCQQTIIQKKDVLRGEIRQHLVSFSSVLKVH